MRGRELSRTVGREARRRSELECPVVELTVDGAELSCRRSRRCNLEDVLRVFRIRPSNRRPGTRIRGVGEKVLVRGRAFE